MKRYIKKFKEWSKKKDLNGTPLWKALFFQRRIPSRYNLLNNQEFKEKIKLIKIGLNIRHMHGSKKVKYGKNELIILCLQKNGENWIKDFIEHHFSLGIKHIVFLDNGSKDNSLDIAKQYDNITIFQTNLPFKENNILMRRYLVQKFGKSRWSLILDVDELWDYPYSNKVKISNLLKYLKKNNYNAVIGQILDALPNEEIKKDYIKKTHNYFDFSNIKKNDYFTIKGSKIFGRNNKLSNNNIKFHTGGVLNSLLNTGNVWLTKMPLIFFDNNLKPLTQQHYSDKAYIADISSVLYHYKFMNDFKEKVKKAVKEENYGGNSAIYKKMHESIMKNKQISFKTKNAKKIEDVNQLVDEGFLIVSGEYLELIK